MQRERAIFPDVNKAAGKVADAMRDLKGAALEAAWKSGYKQGLTDGAGATAAGMLFVLVLVLFWRGKQ